MDFHALMRREVPVPAEVLAMLAAVPLNSHSIFHTAPLETKDDACDEQLVEGWEFKAMALDDPFISR